jgi:hypothetical protein
LIKRVLKYPYLEDMKALGLSFKLKDLRKAKPEKLDEKIFEMLSPTPLRVKETIFRLCGP